MDQKKIGAFIARRRKELDMTQKELAEKLGITDRAVSKWETGRSMPDLSLLQPLSRILKIGVNDLLSGEIIKEENYREKSESNLMNIKKMAELDYLKCIRAGLTGMLAAALFLIIYCCVHGVQTMGYGIAGLLFIFSAIVYYFRYRMSGNRTLFAIAVPSVVAGIANLVAFIVGTW